MKILFKMLLMFSLIGNLQAQGFEKFWASSATSLDGDIKCHSRKTLFWATSGPCDSFTSQDSYKLGDRVNLNGKIVEIGGIQVTRFTKAVRGDERWGLKAIPPGSMSCSVAATTHEILAISDAKLSTTWIQINSCKPSP
jgi:hypothetical protein